MTRPKHLKPRREFPNLNKKNHAVTSDETPLFNCIAYAFGDETRKYWPTFHPDFYWPNSIQKTESVLTFKQLFESVGYAECSDGSHEQGYEKVAIYCDQNGRPKHAARQFSDGRWKSKLGDWYDIEHQLNSVSGGEYGEVRVFLRRVLKS
jgi:hypothetical protein